jgi:hypothetical protein
MSQRINIFHSFTGTNNQTSRRGHLSLWYGKLGVSWKAGSKVKPQIETPFLPFSGLNGAVKFI